MNQLFYLFSLHAFQGAEEESEKENERRQVNLRLIAQEIDDDIHYSNPIMTNTS